LESAASELESAIWAAGWDGEWFRRAYDSFGQPIGSCLCPEGQIYIEPQGICVMAGLGLGDGRAKQALDSVAARLGTPHGLLLLQPAYRRYHLNLGEISSYPPGFKENGGIFCHTNPWIMIAETRIGRGDRAHDYYLRINPSAREDLSDVHRCEPYVYAQMIAGREAPTHGEAKNSWLTGAAAWDYVAITQWILGIRPTHHGLEIAPVIPSLDRPRRSRPRCDLYHPRERQGRERGAARGRRQADRRKGGSTHPGPGRRDSRPRENRAHLSESQLASAARASAPTIPESSPKPGATMVLSNSPSSNGCRR
jgi:hypothetical protein